MKLLYLSEQAFNSLYDHIDSNSDKYKLKTSWLNQFFGSETYLYESNIEYPDFELINTGDKTADDFTNTVTVYKSLGKILTPKQACNKYMWTYLSHDRFWEYTSERWPVDKSSITTRYFCGNSRISLTLNSISRLWWYGYLTYDENNTELPFKLTKLLLSYSDLCQNIIQHEYVMNKKIALGILDGFYNYYEEGHPFNEKQERDLVKHINRFGAVSSLDFFERDELCDMVYRYLCKI